MGISGTNILRDDVRVVAAPHPLRTGLVDAVAPEGATILEILNLVQPDPILMRHAVVYVGDERINREYWHVVRPKKGAQVTVRVLPGFGGGGGGGGQKNVLRIVLIIAVIAAAIYLGPALGAALVGPGGLTIGATTISAASIGGAVIGFSGMLIVNALVPPELPDVGGGSVDNSRANYLTGARNRVRAFEPIPSILGTLRVSPDFGTQPFTEVVGDTNRLRCLYVWGFGELDIDEDSIKIGDTLLSDFEDVNVEHFSGTGSDPASELFANQVDEDAVGVRILQADGYVTRSIGEADELSVDIGFPSGMKFLSSSTGDENSLNVQMEVEFSVTGSGTWQKIPLSDITYKTFSPNFLVDDGGGDLDYINFNYKTTKPIRVGFNWKTNLKTDYDVRLRRLTNDRQEAPSKHTRLDESWWYAVRAIIWQDPIQLAIPLAKTVVLIRATDQLNGVLDEVTGIVTSKCLDWNGATWVNQATNNPASLFRHVLQGPANSNPLSDDRIDLTKLQEWHDFCVENGFAYNAQHSSNESVWSSLTKVARAGRASPDIRDGKWSVVIDQEQALPVTHITPRNSWGFTASKLFPDSPHGWRIPFANENEDYDLDERLVFRDGFDKNNSSLYEQIEFPGVTNTNQIWKLGRYSIAAAINQPEKWTFNQDFESLVVRRGDRVLLTHDVVLIGIASGRIKAVETDGAGDVVSFTSDEIVDIEENKSYQVSIRTAANVEIVVSVFPEPGRTTNIIMQTPIPAAQGVAVGDLFGFGLTGLVTEDALIKEIEAQNDEVALISAVPYRAAIYTADQGTIPEFVTNITPIEPVPVPVITEVRTDESVLGIISGTQVEVRATVFCERVDIHKAFLEIQGRPSETGQEYFPMQVVERGEASITVSGPRSGENWDLRVRWVVEDRLVPSLWAEAFNTLIIGTSTPPEGLQNLTIAVFGGAAFLRWDEPRDLDVRFGGTVRFRHNQSLADAEWTESVSISQSIYAKQLFAVLPLKPGTYLARVFDTSGNPSDDIATISTKQASVLQYANVTSIDEDPTFAGTKTNVEVQSSALQLLETAGFAAEEGTYDFGQNIDLTTVQRVRLTTRLTVGTFLVGDLIDDRIEPIDSWEDFDGGSSEADVTVWVRTTDDDPAGTPTWSEWYRLDSGEFEARGFDFQARLVTRDTSVNISISELGVDVEDVV